MVLLQTSWKRGTKTASWKNRKQTNKKGSPRLMAEVLPFNNQYRVNYPS
jgi:hypothetical protein